jgi:large subunit ribosomal protein L2
MAIKYYKPTTSACRKMSVVDYSGLTKKNPEKLLTVPLNKSTGRDNQGHISVRHKGGGAKRMFRLVSNLQKKMDKVAVVEAIEYDPNRSGFIALIKYADNEKAYILCPEGLKIGDKVVASEKAEIKVGNRTRLNNITTGIEIYDIELIPGRGKGQIVKSAGSAATVAAQAEGTGKRSQYVQVKLPSGELRLIHGECFASIGRVSNPDHSSMRIAKAGRKRHMGVRPSVRGKAMNPRSHPHGGGEGVNPIGLKYPKTPWGKPAMGYKTRKNKYSDKFIIRRKND